MNCTLMQLYNSGESVQGDRMLKIFHLECLKFFIMMLGAVYAYKLQNGLYLKNKMLSLVFQAGYDSRKNT